MRRLLLAAAAALLSLSVPAATAQQGADVAIEVEAPPAPIQPQVENPSFEATVTVSCVQLLRSAGPAGLQGVPVTIDWSTQSGVVVTGPRSLSVDPQRCASGGAVSVRQSGVFQLSIPRAAPGLEPIPLRATATVGDATSAPFPFTVTGDYYPVNEARLERKLVSCSPCRDVALPFQVTNLGNARTQYTFTLASGPGGGWSIRLPDVLVLDSRAAGNVTAHVSGHGGQASFSLAILPTAADDPTKAGDPLTVDLLVRDTSLLSKATPGPAPAPLLAGLAALAVALSRRRA
jgi:hypothetical protein